MEKKQRKLTAIILKWILSIAIVAIILAIALFLLANLLFSIGIILPANVGEQSLAKQEERLMEDFDPQRIFPFYQYALFEENGELLKTTMNEESLRDAQENLHRANDFGTGSVRYHRIEQEEKILILRYEIKVRYHNERLNQFLPSWETLGIVIFLVAILWYCYFVAKRLSKIVTRNMEPIIRSTEQIARQELDFDIPQSEIQEFSEINAALTNMKKALQQSLEMQWKNEQDKRQQLAALAHDIGTPLTSIIARSELLLESCQSSYDKHALTKIIAAGSQIRTLLNLMIDLSLDKPMNIQRIEQDLRGFFALICDEAKIQARRKKQVFLHQISFANGQKGYFDQIELERAIYNILNNAFEYAPEHAKIFLSALVDHQGFLVIEIDNEGSFFSKEDICSASTLFYRAKKERNADNHYGIGLYVANEIANAHNGEIFLKNTKDGAKVKLKVFIQKIDNELDG